MERTNELGKIEISYDVIAEVIGTIVGECYGIVGTVSKNFLKDGVREIFKKGNASKGIAIREENEELEIDMYVVVGYGVNISEVAHNIQEQVRHELIKMFGLNVKSINVYVQGVKNEG